MLRLSISGVALVIAACTLTSAAPGAANPVAPQPRGDVLNRFCDQGTTGFAVLRPFGNSPDGWQPWGTPTLLGARLWGRTTFGDGNGSAGVIWSMDPSEPKATYRIRHRFGGTVPYSVGGTGPDVSNPHHDWLRIAPGGTVLLGAGKWGGRAGVGGLFGFDTSNGTYRVLHSFNGISKQNPHGSVADGANPHSNPHPARAPRSGRNILVGMTAFGGRFGLGTIYRILPNGAGFVLLHSFNSPSGSMPHGFVIQSGSFLYGMTGSGGFTPPESNFPSKAAWAPFSQGNGVVFRLNMINGAYKVLHRFGYLGPNSPGTLPGGIVDGAAPDHGGLVLSNGRLFGLATYGGRNGGGVLFSVRPDGSGYRVKRTFAPPVAAPQLSQPHGTLVPGPDNWLYALTAAGGGANAGGVIRYNSVGSRFQQLHAFNGAAGGALGEDDPAVVANCAGRVGLLGMTKDGGAIRSTFLPTHTAPDWTADQPSHANGTIWKLVLPRG